MPRYMRDFPMIGTPDQMYGMVRDYLFSEGYVETNVKGENVLKKGDGWVSGPTCFKISFYGNFMRMESWMLYAVLPGVYGGEIGVDGFVGSATKGPWKKRIAHIEQMLASATPYLNAGMAAVPAYAQQAANAMNNGFASAAAMPQQMPVTPQPATRGFCGNCGAPLEPDSAFCTNCGARV